MKELLLKMLLPNGSALAVATFTNIQDTLKIAILSASLIYSLLHIALAWRKLRGRK